MDQDSRQPSPNQPDQSSLQTELHQLRAELQRTQLAYRLAQESEQFKAGFLARTAHELRSPLSSVMSLQQLILSDLCEDPAEEREAIGQAYEAAQKLLALLDQLINVSKTVYGTEPLQVQAVCLEDVFMEVEGLLMLQAQNRRQVLTLDYPDSALQVQADPRWLRQVLVGLVDTPMRLMQEGEITVKPQIETDRVWIEIADQRPASFWNEPTDLLHQLAARSQAKTDAVAQAASPAHRPNLPDLLDLEAQPSPSLALLTHQMILELMGGGLEVLAVPTAQDPLSRIRCWLPRV
jgi:K+-sensing histidine kinase KdpD